MEYTQEERSLLLKTGRESIKFFLDNQKILPFEAGIFPAHLLEKRATFVTLKHQGKLRGCIGILEAVRPLALDVIHNAHAAAFRDTRFYPLSIKEFEDLDLEISVLSPIEPVEFLNEQDLLGKLRPGTDGLCLEDGMYHGAFLPQMWQQLPVPRDFLNQLKVKAGLPPSYWSESLQVVRFTVEIIHQ